MVKTCRENRKGENCVVNMQGNRKGENCVGNMQGE